MVQIYYMGLPSPAVFKLAISGFSQLTLPLFDQYDEAKIEFSVFVFLLFYSIIESSVR